MGRNRRPNIVPYAETQKKAKEEGLMYLDTEILQFPLAENDFTAVAKAVVRNADGTRRFSGIGDASPNEVDRQGNKIKAQDPAANSTIRMAETRAKGRAMKEFIGTADPIEEEMGGAEYDGSEEGPPPDPDKSGAVKGGAKQASGKANDKQVSAIIDLANELYDDRDEDQSGAAWLLSQMKQTEDFHDLSHQKAKELLNRLQKSKSEKEETVA